MNTFGEAPFYLQRVVPAVHHTMGGVHITTDAQVVLESRRDRAQPLRGRRA